MSSARADLDPCPKCENRKLRFHTWSLGEGSYVWCPVCGFGSPELLVPELIAHGEDALEVVAKKWNAITKQSVFLRCVCGQSELTFRDASFEIRNLSSSTRLSGLFIDRFEHGYWCPSCSRWVNVIGSHFFLT